MSQQAETIMSYSRVRKKVYPAWLPCRLRTKVYFVVCEITQSVKCGIAVDVDKRLAGMQTGCPTPLRVMASFEGDLFRERRIHKRLTNFRRHGEWFRYCDDVREIIIDELTLHLEGAHQFAARERLRTTLPLIRHPP